MYCTPNFTIKTIDCNFTSEVNSPPHTTNLLSVEDSIITHNPLGIYNYDSGTLQNIISGDTVLLGGLARNDDANVALAPSSIIKKIESTASEIRFYITPPPLHIPVAPYLHQIKEDLYDEIQSSNMLEDHSSYRMYLACFSKYFKKSADNAFAFGGIFHRSPTSTFR